MMYELVTFNTISTAYQRQFNFKSAGVFEHIWQAMSKARELGINLNNYGFEFEIREYLDEKTKESDPS